MFRKGIKKVVDVAQVVGLTIVFAGILSVAWQLHTMTPRAQANSHMTLDEWVAQETDYLMSTDEYKKFDRGQAEDLVRVKLQGDNDSALNTSIQEGLHAADKYQK